MEVFYFTVSVQYIRHLLSVPYELGIFINAGEQETIKIRARLFLDFEDGAHFFSPLSN